MENYIVCDGNKYIIKDNDIFKIFNKELIIPTKSELKKVKDIINNTNKSIFSSSKLNEIAKKNKELYKIDILPEILERMEKFIGEEYIELFYKNLETVRFEFDDPINCIDYDACSEYGYHESKDNIIHINGDTFDCLRQRASIKDLDFTLTWKIALAHELFHMASCNNLYDETGYIYQGLNEINLKKRYQSPTDLIKYGISSSFNEGITQFFACSLYNKELGDDFHDFNNSYTIQARVICQLIPLVKYPEIENAYFKNLGIGYINDKLVQINKRKLLYNELSTNMGRSCSDKSNDKVKATSIVKLQTILLQYEKAFIDLIDQDKINSLIDVIGYFYLGVPDDVNLSDEIKMQVEENLNTYNSLKEKQKTYTK